MLDSNFSLALSSFWQYVLYLSSVIFQSFFIVFATPAVFPAYLTGLFWFSRLMVAYLTLSLGHIFIIKVKY